MSGIITGYSRSWEFGEPIAPRLKWSLTSPPKELWHHYLHVMIVIVFVPVVVVVRIPWIVKDVCAFNPGPKSLNRKSWQEEGLGLQFFRNSRGLQKERGIIRLSRCDSLICVKVKCLQ